MRIRFQGLKISPLAEVKWCGGWDLNPRTPTGQGPEPCAFDLSWQPPRERKKDSAFDKCLSCFGAVPVGKIRPTFDPVSGRIVLNQLPGRNTLSRRSPSQKISMLFSTPGGGRFSRAPPFVKGSKKCF